MGGYPSVGNIGHLFGSHVLTEKWLFRYPGRWSRNKHPLGVTVQRYLVAAFDWSNSLTPKKARTEMKSEQRIETQKQIRTRCRDLGRNFKRVSIGEEATFNQEATAGLR